MTAGFNWKTPLPVIPLFERRYTNVVFFGVVASFFASPGTYVILLPSCF